VEAEDRFRKKAYLTHDPGYYEQAIGEKSHEDGYLYIMSPHRMT